MIPTGETFFVLVPAASIQTRHINLSVHRRRDDIQELSDGRLLIEVPSANSAEFLDFEWLDAEGARALVGAQPQQTASVWSRVFRRSSSGEIA